MYLKKACSETRGTSLQAELGVDVKMLVAVGTNYGLTPASSSEPHSSLLSLLGWKREGIREAEVQGLMAEKTDHIISVKKINSVPDKTLTRLQQSPLQEDNTRNAKVREDGEGAPGT